MSEPRTPASERIERTRYRERQHEDASVGEPSRYGDPQHGPERTNPDVVDRLGYEDDHWDDGHQWASEETHRDGETGPPAAEPSSGALGTLA